MGDGRVGSREAPTSVPLLAVGKSFVALPFAMTPSHAQHPSAAALIASNATSEGTVVNAHAHVWLGNDLVALDPETVPTEHYPLAQPPTAPYWLDALDSSIAWYAPAFALVTPAARDDPAGAAFSFVFAKTGAALGPGGTLQAGLNATVRLTVKQVMSTSTALALSGHANLKPQPVPLQNLSCALEIPYRQSGLSTVQTQRFPGTITQSSDQIAVTVALLDDWVRLSYSALAYPPATGMPPPRVIVDYAFMCYWRMPSFDGGGVVGGGLVHHLPTVETASELPHQVLAPTLIRRDLAVVGPTSTLRYNLEAPGAPRAATNMPLQTAAIAVARPDFGIAHRLVWRIATRSLVREEIVEASLACANYGNFYLQRMDGGGMVAIGCQDSLKLGDTSLHAFEEIAALRDPAFRIYRSLQQPGRFLVSPAAFRVGRYSASAGDRAFRPMMVLYGVLDNDPTQSRYALTATLIPDIPASALAKLNERLGAYTPAGSTPTIVYPTDPFVAAKISYAWAIPNGLDAPQAITVLDAVNVTLSMPLANAALLTAMINRGGVQGGITFTLPDGSAIDAALVVDSNVVGPAESGPVTATLRGRTATLQNRTQQTMIVADLVTVAPSGSTQTSAVNMTLAAGATATASVNAGAVLAFADGRAASPSTIDELDIFVEDVTVTVTFINQVNFADHQLTALGVQARLKNSSHVETANLPEGKTADVSFTLPITNYLAQQTLQYALVETRAGAPPNLAWREWDLNKGTVIGITADQL
jgi:hypothetical protein